MFSDIQKPNIEIETQLKNHLNTYHENAAIAIQDADIILVITGAGWGVPSGLKTYNDVAKDYDGINYQQLCDPNLLNDRTENTIQKYVEDNNEDDEDDEDEDFVQDSLAKCINKKNIIE